MPRSTGKSEAGDTATRWVGGASSRHGGSGTRACSAREERGRRAGAAYRLSVREGVRWRRRSSLFVGCECGRTQRGAGAVTTWPRISGERARLSRRAWVPWMAGALDKTLTSHWQPSGTPARPCEKSEDGCLRLFVVHASRGPRVMAGTTCCCLSGPVGPPGLRGFICQQREEQLDKACCRGRGGRARVERVSPLGARPPSPLLSPPHTPPPAPLQSPPACSRVRTADFASLVSPLSLSPRLVKLPHSHLTVRRSRLAASSPPAPPSPLPLHFPPLGLAVAAPAPLRVLPTPSRARLWPDGSASGASIDPLDRVVASEKRALACSTWLSESKQPPPPSPPPTRTLAPRLSSAAHLPISRRRVADAQGVQDPFRQGHRRRQAQEGPQRARSSPPPLRTNNSR